VRCAAGIIDRLRDGRYPEGQVIPGLGGPGGLCTELGTGTPAVKKALGALAAKGYLTRDGTSYYPGPFKPWEWTAKGSPDFASRFLEGDRYITVAELARMARVSRTTAYHIARSGDIDDVTRAGSLIRIPFSGARAYVNDLGFGPGTAAVSRSGATGGHG
jgi:Bacterial regulatory proteins, gntR family